MSRLQVQRTTTLEENFMFGSPPLLKGFVYNSCRPQESSFSHSFENHVNTVHFTEFQVSKKQNKQSAIHDKQNFDGVFTRKNITHLCSGEKNDLKIPASTEIITQDLVESTANKEKHVTAFYKRKDLSTLKNVLSKERFRQVDIKFRNNDEEGQEIINSVHETLKATNRSHMKCVFCVNESKVYDSFPVVDGTLFLSPVKLSKDCLNYLETCANSSRYMCFACAHCMEGKPNNISCSGCGTPWNGSFFQIGTLYSYNILSAIPCCKKRSYCSACSKPIVDVGDGEGSFFSYYSTKIACPHCKVEDYHFVKSVLYSSKPICG